jgi:uncharacterized protein (DUF924 family)
MDSLAVAILDFWFGSPGTPERGAERDAWFRKDPAFDDAIRQRFGDAVNVAVAGGYGEWCNTAGGALARVLLLDQFTRNIFRDTPRAFAGDARALATAEDVIARGLDREPNPGRWFAYMPFDHAEDVAAAARSTRIFGAGTRYERCLVAGMGAKHADVVFSSARFHRNASSAAVGAGGSRFSRATGVASSDRNGER